LVIIFILKGTDPVGERTVCLTALGLHSVQKRVLASVYVQ